MAANNIETRLNRLEKRVDEMERLVGRHTAGLADLMDLMKKQTDHIDALIRAAGVALDHVEDEGGER
jgi:hypothetical protein